MAKHIPKEINPLNPETWRRWYNPFHGMEVHPDPHANHFRHRGLKWRGNENGILFLVEWLLLSRKAMGRKTFPRQQETASLIWRLTTSLPTVLGGRRYFPGLTDRGTDETHDAYNAHPDKSAPAWKVRAQSHDNFTAIAVFSYLAGYSFHEDIVRRLNENWGRLDNVYPLKPRWTRFMHPRDQICWRYLTGSFWATLLLPIGLFFRLWPLFFPKKEWWSGKYGWSTVILTWLWLHCVPDRWYWRGLKKFLNWYMRKRFGGWKRVFSDYFFPVPDGSVSHPDHPNRHFPDEVYEL